MTMKFTSAWSTKVTTKDFFPLIEVLTTTIENHLQYVEDEATSHIFSDLVCNGIKKKEILTVTAVAHMLDMTDKNKMQLAPVISSFFETIPVLQHYWQLTKVKEIMYQ